MQACPKITALCYTSGVDTGMETKAVRLNWYRRLFAWLTRHEAPPGVDPEAHRKALWAAFVFCTVAFTTSTLVIILETILILYLQPLWDKLTFLHTNLVMLVITSLQQFSPGDILNALFFAFLVYAIVLRLRGNRLPSSVMDMMVTAVFASLILDPFGALPPSRNYGYILYPALFALVLRYRGHLHSGNARLLFFLASTLSILFATIGAIAFRLTQMGNPGSMSLPFESYFTASYQFSGIVFLPLAIMLPIALLASARTPNPPLVINAKRKPFSATDLLSGLSILFATALAANMVWFIPQENYWVSIFIGGFTSRHAGMGYVLLALAIAALMMPRVSHQFRAFLVCALCLYFLSDHFVFYLRWIPLDTTAPEMVVMGLGALWLATQGKISKAKMLAAAMIVLNSFAIAMWMSLEKPVGKIASLYGDSAPLLVGLKIGAYELVLLALLPAMLLTAWWFLAPDDVEALFKRQA
jgi:hypothetical protein